MDKDNASAKTLETALRGYASGIALLMGHTDIDHVDVFAIRKEEDKETFISVTGWSDGEEVISHSEFLED